MNKITNGYSLMEYNIVYKYDFFPQYRNNESHVRTR